MPCHCVHRPIARAVLALVAGIASVTTPHAAIAGVPPDAAILLAQAKEFARGAWSDGWLAAAGDDLPGLPASLAFVQSEFGQPREIVKNAPYSAEAVTESVQVLGDGNRIVRKSTVLLARDSAGRTRQERKDDGRSAVYLQDPVEGRSVILDERARTAIRLPRVPAPPEPPALPTKPSTAVPPVPPVPPAGSAPERVTKEIEVQPGRVVVKRRSVDGAGDDVRVEVIRIAGPGSEALPLPPTPPLPPLTLPLVPRGAGETRSLGSRDFDGVKADGTLTTYTIPAGKVGNERPIVITSERWFSPELNVVVYARTQDPRAGETSYRLVNVQRAEPPAELFKVPTDYRVKGETRRS